MILRPLIIATFGAFVAPALRGQHSNFQLGVRLPVQWERQNAIIEYSWGEKLITGHAVNFGADLLGEFVGEKWSVYAGLGYFRSRFKLSRHYDHQALNPIRDSFPYGSITRHYTYSLIRLPVGVKYTIGKNDQARWEIGLEHQLNWSMKRKYAGPPFPYENGNDTYIDQAHHSNTVNLLFLYSLKLSRSTTVTAAPYIRMFNRYKKDFILFEREPEMHTRLFDAFGLHIQYSFTP